MQDVLTSELVYSNEDQQELQKVSLLHGQWRRKVEADSCQGRVSGINKICIS